MANLKEEIITSSDLQEYLNDYSDFSFEMEILNSLTANFEVQHGGTYEDPITNKFREFDIRAKHTVQSPFDKNTYLAVEAKNLRKNLPILISCVPRQKDEAYHQIIISKFATRENERKFRPYGRINNIAHHYNKIYEPGEFVGKSLNQIGRKAHNNEFLDDDSVIYKKWSQAVNSCYDLAQNAYLLSKRDTSHSVYINLILPIVVIPDGTLWKVNFDLKGNQIGEPENCESCQYYIGNKFKLGDEIGSDDFKISHLHFMTLSGFQNFVKNLDTFQKDFFPQDRITF